MSRSNIQILRDLIVGVLCVGMASVSAQAQGRPTVGVAFGGGSARGIAHVGVIKWFEEHHIPIDVAAGTSMGGLIGGVFATGMDAAEIDDLLKHINWDEMFGASSFAFKNIRRKADAEAYPSRLELGLKHRLMLPPSLNDGAQIDLLVARIAAPYYAERTFDDLPTPFRLVAMDLLTAKRVVLDRGQLAPAMRATMSLPLIFPPVHLDGHVLVDGGTMDNVPADVVKGMGATRVVAVNVGNLDDLTSVDYSMLSLGGETLDAMMRANTKAGIAQADIIINVPLAKYGSLDWRRSDELIAEGYRAAEAMRDSLLPLAISDAEYAQWHATRQARRKTTLPIPAFLRVEGFSTGDARRAEALLAGRVGQPLDTDLLETDLAALSGLDRYESLLWRVVEDPAGRTGLLVEGQAKSYGPPFLMMGLNLENTTSADFRLTLTSRYLAYDLVGPGSELRVDATIGSDPGVGLELYRPVRSTPLFVAPYAAVKKQMFDVIEDDAIVASYSQTLSDAGLNVGVNLGRLSDLRVGASVGWLSAQVKIGDPGLPAVTGKELEYDMTWRLNSQDSPVVPSLGSAVYANLRYLSDGPDITPPLPTGRSSVGLAQLAGEGNTFWTVRQRDRVFVLGGGGTSFGSSPLPTDQFRLGAPLHLGAYNQGELRGDHYYVLTAGYLKQIGRLPDFLGGSIYAGSWLDNGDAFDAWSAARFRTNVSGGLIMDTLVGPVIVAASAGFDSRWRMYFGVGRIFGGKH